MGDRKDRSERQEATAPFSDLEAPPTQVMPSADAPGCPPGMVVAERYRVLETLGIGGMGVVYRVHDNVLGVELALKMLRPEIAQDESFLQRFRNELLTARQVTHRHVVRNHDIGMHEGSYFLTMDFVRGRSLQQLLRQEGKLEADRALGLVRQIAEGLAESHRQGIVHRDLKPANILLDDSGDAYVSDFGIARSLGSAGLTRTGEVIGSPDYLSPEQARGETVDGRSDLYSLGLMLIEMLSGKLPFPGGTLFEILTQRMHGNLTSLADLGIVAPPALESLIDRCVQKDPAERYQTAEELVADLDAIAGPSGVRRGKLARRGRAWSRPALAAAAMVAVVLGGLATWHWVLTPAPTSDAFAADGTDADLPLLPEVEIVFTEPRHSVAVMPFAEEAGRSDLAWASTGVAEMLATSLAESEDLRVVESVRVAQILEDLGFEPQRLRQDEVEQVADFLQVDRVVLGKLRSIGDQIRLEMRLLEIDQPGTSPRMIGTRSGSVEQLFDLVEQLGSSLRAALAVQSPVVVGLSLTASATAMRAYAEGVAALSQRESLKAAPALERAVAEDPRFTIAWVRLSQAYQDLGRREEAHEAARQAVESAGGAGGRLGFEARAQEALLSGEPEQAQKFLEDLVKQYPNDSEAHVALAEAYGQQGKFAKAVTRLERAVQLDSSEPRAWYLLGRFAIMAGETQRAVDEYLVRALVQQKRLGNEQGQAEVHNALGVGYQRLGIVDQAVQSYEAAAQIRERVGDRRGQAVTLHNLAFVQISTGDYDSAEENIRQALRIHTELENEVGIGKLTNSYGLLEEERGRYAEAFEQYKRSLKVREELGDQRGLAESHNNVGYAYYLLGQYDNAQLYLRRARELYQENEDQGGALLVLPNLGTCQLAQGSWSEALSSFLEALKLSRELDAKEATAIIRGILGQVAHYQGRYSAALAAYREALPVLAEVGNQRAGSEVALREAEALLELGAPARAGERLDQAENWELGNRNAAHRSRLNVLRAKWQLQRRGVEAARQLLSEAVELAQQAQSPALLISAQIGSGRFAITAGETDRALAVLGVARDEAARIGHAVLELRAGEALAAAELETGDLERAETVLRQAFKVVDKCGSYARTYRLRQLLSETLSRRGETEAAVEQTRLAREELSRIRDNVDDDLRRSFDQLPEVRELLAGL